jgi:CheY-like chemotaxis protein
MRFKKTKIGIVEDKPVLRNHLVDRLKRFQHLQTTMVFPNGEVLLNVLRQTDPEDYPDIILMDISKYSGDHPYRI